MREILFKAKRKDTKEWLEGFPIRIYDYGGKVWEMHPFETNFSVSCYVIPETICEFTGKVDKNGTKIFEGDIVRTQPFSDRPYSKKAKYKQHIGVVEYHVRHFKNSLYEQDYEAHWRVNIKEYDGYGCCNWSAFFKCEIVGNIYDNYELLNT